MKVTISIEVDLLDDDTARLVDRITSTTVLADEQVTTADVANVYDMARQEIMDEADKEGRTPVWGYPRKYGKRSKACKALLPLYARTISTVTRSPWRQHPTALPGEHTGGTKASPVRL